MTKLLSDLELTVKNYYSVQSMQFEVSDKKVDRNLVFVKDSSDFVMNIISKRVLNPYNTIIRVSIDGGGGSLKICVNIFDADELKVNSSNIKNRSKRRGSDEYIGSGVQRIQFIAIAEDVPETYQNIKQILDIIQLDSLGFHSAWDLKLANMIMGLSGYGGIHACLYCESEKSINAGTLRTFGSLDIHLSEFQAAGEKKETAQLYKNVIRKRLIHLDEDPEVKAINKIPPSSLHIFMGFINVLSDLVFTLWPNFNQWLSGKYIFRHGYHKEEEFDGGLMK